MTEPTSHTGDQLRAGDLFACEWRLDRALGSGGMARVFSAMHVSGRRDALKILHAHLAADPSTRARFLREAAVTSRVRHPGVVQVLSSGESPSGRPYVALELLRGATLDALWKQARRCLPIHAVLRAIDQVLDVLAACHDQGVLHRDMKPSNVFVTDAGQVRLLDFGLARLPGVADDLAKRGTALGTPGYMAPEQAAGAWDHVDASSDVFAVGATLFALLSGMRLHGAVEDRRAFEMAATSPAPSLATVLPDAPPQLVELVDRALCWDNRQRFADASAMRDALRRVIRDLGGDTEGALPTTPARRRALHAHVLDGREPAEVHAVAQAFSWLEDVLRPDLPELATRAAREAAIEATERWLGEAGPAQGVPFEVMVQPFGFRAFGYNVWEPAPPLDQVPRRLHAAGVRALRFGTRVDARAARALATVLLTATREQGSALAANAWGAAVTGFSVALIRPFVLIEATHGTEITTDIGRTASLLRHESLRDSQAVTERPCIDEDSATRLRNGLVADRAALMAELATRFVRSADEAGEWARALRAFPGTSDPQTLLTAVQRLADSGTAGARSLVEGLAARRQTPAGAYAGVQLCGDPEGAASRLLAMTEAIVPDERRAALMASASLGLTQVAEHVLGTISSESFAAMAPDEREARLELLFRVLPDDGERVAVRLLQRHGVLADESHDATRRVAARLLGRFGSTQTGARALRAATTPMWWNTREVREAAAAAADELEARLAQAGEDRRA